MAKKKLGTDLPEEAVEGFNGWCDANGYVRARAAVAALKTFQMLPLWIRDLALRGEWNHVSAVIPTDPLAVTEAQLIGGIEDDIRADRQAKRRKNGRNKLSRL